MVDHGKDNFLEPQHVDDNYRQRRQARLAILRQRRDLREATWATDYTKRQVEAQLKAISREC
eukprot:5824108-Pyramimonas_sp.AAC.1